MLDKWRNYALKNGKIKSCYQREYCNRNASWKTPKTSNRHCYAQSGQSQTKEEVGNHEIVREEITAEAHQQGQQRVQGPAKRRRKAESSDSKIQAGEEEVKGKEKEKMTAKEKKHEAKEIEACEKKEDRREAKKEAAKKKK